MTILTEVRFAHEDGALADTLSAFPDLTVSIVRETSTAPDQNVFFFRFDDVPPERIRLVLENDRTVRDASPISAIDDHQLWGIEFTSETKLLGPEVTKEGGFVVDARSSPTRRTPRGWLERWFLPDHSGLHNIWQHAQAAGFEFDVRSLSQQLQSGDAHIDSDPLTEQQRTALVMAYERGYFAEPRTTSLEELADSLDLSPSAVNGRLKRGLRALIGTTLIIEATDDDGVQSGNHGTTEYHTRSGTVAINSQMEEHDE